VGLQRERYLTAEAATGKIPVGRMCKTHEHLAGSISVYKYSLCPSFGTMMLHIDISYLWYFVTTEVENYYTALQIISVPYFVMFIIPNLIQNKT
jgi:hypothetical protein